MKLSKGHHLAYCTNVHRGNNWAETFASLENDVMQVKKKVCPDNPYAIGLRPQTNGIRIIRTYLFLYLHHIIFKRGKGFCPIITPVDIGAVSQVMSL